MFVWQRMVLLALSGLSVGLSVVSGWWLVLIIAIAAWLWLFSLCLNWKQRFMTGFVFTFAKTLVALSWFFSAHPMEWLLGSASTLSFLLLTLYWLLAATFVATGAGVMATLVVVDAARPVRMLLSALIVTIGESVGAVVFAVGTLGAGASVQSNFSFGYVGYALAHHDYFLPLAQWGGVYGLSLLVYTLAILTVLAFITKRWWWAFAMICLLVTPLLTTDQYRAIDKRVTIIDTAFPLSLTSTPDGFAVKKMALEEAVVAAVALGVTTIVLPEDARFVSNSFISPDAAQRWWQSQFPAGVAAALYDSGRTKNEAGETILRGHILHTSGLESAYFDKSYLVPQGEYLPYFAEVGLTLLANQPTQERLRNHMSYRPSIETRYPVDQSLASFLFCFEAVNPFGVKTAQMRHQSSFMVHPVSHGWFVRPSHALRNQIIAMLKVQAVWNQVPIVVAGNEFPGFVVMSNGAIEPGKLLTSGEYWELTQFEI